MARTPVCSGSTIGSRSSGPGAGARTLREAAEAGAKLTELRRIKREQLDVVYRILSIHLGTPPAAFEWQWRDSKKKFHRDRNMTPQRFAARKALTLRPGAVRPAVQHLQGFDLRVPHEVSRRRVAAGCRGVLPGEDGCPARSTEDTRRVGIREVDAS